MLVQTIGAWVTIVAVLVGGGWALWRYRRQKPDLPRVNARVDATLSSVDSVDYITFAVTITHVSGDLISIRRHPEEPRPQNEVEPKVMVTRLSRTSTEGNLPETAGVEAEVLTHDYTLGSGEFVEDHGVVSVGPRHRDTMA